MSMSEIEFGKLQSDVAHIYKTVEAINKKLDAAVPMTEYLRNKQEVDVAIEDVKSRLATLETLEKIKQNSFWHKVGMRSETAIVGIVVAGVISALGMAVFLNSQFTKIRTDIEANANTINETRKEKQ